VIRAGDRRGRRRPNTTRSSSPQRLCSSFTERGLEDLPRARGSFAPARSGRVRDGARRSTGCAAGRRDASLWITWSSSPHTHGFPSGPASRSIASAVIWTVDPQGRSDRSARGSDWARSAACLTSGAAPLVSARGLQGASVKTPTARACCRVRLAKLFHACNNSPG
jgi:hypothetical protein